jgi:hypothetical protein
MHARCLAAEPSSLVFLYITTEIICEVLACSAVTRRALPVNPIGLDQSSHSQTGYKIINIIPYNRDVSTSARVVTYISSGIVSTFSHLGMSSYWI